MQSNWHRLGKLQVQMSIATDTGELVPLQGRNMKVGLLLTGPVLFPYPEKGII